MPRTTPRGNVITYTGGNKKTSSQKSSSQKTSSQKTSSQKTSSQKTSSQKATKSPAINTPNLTETIHNLIAAAKSEQDKKSSTSKSVNFGNTIQNSTQEDKVANIINKIKNNGILSSSQGNEAATIKNNTTGRTHINPLGQTVETTKPYEENKKFTPPTPLQSGKLGGEKDKEYQEGLKKATQLNAEDNPLIGAGSKKSVSTSTQADINNFVQNWDSIPTEQRAAAARYIAYNEGITNENRSAIMDAYNNSTGQDKINILNAILYKSGQNADTQKMINALSPAEQKLLVDSASASVYGENTLSNQIKGQAAIAPYMAAVTQSRADAYEQEWAKKNYTAADVHRDTILRKVGGVSAAVNDHVGLTAADVVTKDRELMSPLHGVDLVKNDLLTNTTAIGKNFVNFFMYEIENAVDAGGNIYGGDSSKLYDDIRKKIYDWGTNLNEDYRRESAKQEIRADAANLTKTDKVIDNVIGYVTQMAPIIAVSALNPTAGLGLLGTSSAGQYARQAYDSGASLKDSVTYGIMGGLGEVLSEKMFTGFGWFGKGIGNAIASKTGKTVLSDSTREILEGFKNSATGRAFEFFIHAGAEATEEMTMQVLQSYMQKATYNPDAQNATLKEILSAGGYGAVVSGILGLPATALGVTSAIGDKTNNQAYQQALKETAATQISKIQDLLKSNQITPEQAKYSIEEINNAAQKSIDALSGKGNISAAKPVKQEYKKTSNYMQVATDYKEAFTMLKQLAEGKKPGDQVSVALIENGTVKIDTAIVGKYGVAYVHQRLAGPNESTAFKHKAANIIDAKGNEVRQSGLQNNLTESVISLAEHLEKESGKKVRFLSEAAYEQNGKKYTKQGHQDNDTIYLNADSTNPSAQIFSHELTHALKRNNKQYDFFKNYVFDNYKNSLEDERARIYGVYSRAGIDLKTMDDVDDEVLARFVEKKLLTDEETIKTVIKKNRSFAQKVIEWLNDTIQRLLGNKEERFLVDARNLYRKLLDVDRAANIKVSEKSETEEKTFDVKYSVEEKKDIRHIKEQIADNLDVLNKMEPVANVEKEPFQNLKAKENISEILRELKPKGYQIDRKDFGIINFGPSEINRGWDYVSKDAEALSFFAVHNVLKRGVEIHSIVDHKDRRYSSVTFAAPVIINGKRGNLAVAVIQTNGNHYRAHRILAPDGMALMLDKKTSTELTPGEGGRNAVFSPISSVLDTTVSQKDDGVKGEDKQKFSVTEEENSKYMSAVDSGDMETAQKMVDDFAAEWAKNSKIRDENGKLIRVYHGTMEDFTVFDRTKGRANMDIQGNFFSPWEEDAVGYGTNVKAYYLNITNPATESVGYSALKKHTDENNAGVSARDDLIAKGYDGVNNSDEEYIAFDSNQIKSADPVTYDDKGDVIPLSERFNNKEEDIRYSIEEEPTKENPEMQSILDDLEKLDDQEKASQKVSTMPVVSRVLKKPVPYLYEGKEFGEWTGRSYSEGYTHKLEFKWLDDGKKEWLTENELINKIKDHEASRKKDYPVKPEEFYVPGDEVYVGKDLVTIDKGKTRKEGGVMYTVEYADGQKVEVPGTSLSVVPSNGSAVLQGLKNSDIEVKTQMKNILTGLKQDLGFRTKGRKELNDQIMSTAQKIMIRGFYNPSDVTRLLDSAYKTGVEQQPLEDIQIAAKDHLKGTRIYVTEDIRGEMNFLGGMKEINRKMFGNDTRLTIKRDGAVGLDDLYSELNSLYPDVFPDSIDPTDQLQLIMDAATAKKRERSFEDIDNELLRNDVPEESTIKGEMKQNIEAAFQQLSALYDQSNTELDNFREIPPENSEPEEYPSFEDLRDAEKIEWDNPPEGWDVVDGYEVPIETSEPPPPEELNGKILLPGNEAFWNAKEQNPLETAAYKEMTGEFGDQLKDHPEEEIEMDWAWVRKLRGNSHSFVISFSKDYARNFDAAAYNYPTGRKKLKDLFETPFVRAKREYVNAVKKMYDELYVNMKDLGIKKGSKESAAVQKYGEGYYLVPKTLKDLTGQKYVKNEKIAYTIDDLKKEFPTKWENIVQADAYFRGTYDKYIPIINEAREKIYGNVVEAHRRMIDDTQEKIDFYKSRLSDLNQKSQDIQITISSKKQQLNETKTAKAKDRIEKSIRYNEDRLISLREEITRNKNHMGYQISAKKNLALEEKSKEYLKNKMLLPRQDYYHHMRMESSFLQEVIGLGRNTSEIDPIMEGLSAYTEPKSKWSGILAHQGMGTYQEDAVGAFIDYIQAAEYMVHIDPVIAQFRDYIKAMAEATQDTKNINKLILWLTNWTNDLAGKTNHIDRVFQDGIGRERLRVFRKLNNMAKGNAVVGNLSSAAVQFSNLPNALKYIKNPKSWTRGTEIYIEWLHGEAAARDLVGQSTFLSERYLDNELQRFDEKWFQQPKKLAIWSLSVGDQQTSVAIWCAAYDDAVRKGIENPVEYADDITMKSVAGRGIGEIPLTQKSSIIQMVAPFQIEVNNTWQMYKENTRDLFHGDSKKKRLSALDSFARLFIGDFVINTVTAMTIGRRILWDPIYVLFECIKEWLTGDDDKDKNWFDKFKELMGHELGALIGAIPFGAQIAYYLINNQWARTNLFGEDYDPTRYGVGNIVADWLVDNVTDKDDDILDNVISFLTTFVTPWGGKQLERILNGLRNLGALPTVSVSSDGLKIDLQDVTGSYNTEGNLKFPMETFASDPYQALIGLIFGQYSTEAGEEYVDKDYSALTDRETQAFKDLVAAGADSFEVYETIRAMKACGNDTDKREVLIDSDLTDDEKYGLYLNAVISAKSADNERLDINSILGSSLTIDDYFKIRNEKNEIGKSDVEDSSTAFSEWVDSQGYTSKQQEAISKTFGSLTKYDSLTAAGLDSATAAQVSKVLSALEPLNGEDNVSSLQRYEAIAGMDLAEDQKNAAMSAVMTAKQYKAYSIGTEYGVTTQAYVDYKNALTTANTDGNNGYSQDETKAAIDTLNISSSAKAALWQMTNKGWKAEHNPYNTSISSAVQEKLKTEEEEPKKTDADMCPLAGDYTVSSWYGYRDVTVGSKFHRANDLACPVGTPVISVKNGKVTSITKSSSGYGLSIEVTDEDGNVEKYSHLSTVGMEVGDTVSAGTQIAESGNTGTTTGPHLDFKYMKDGQWVDPSLYFNIGEGSGTETATGGYAAKAAAAGGSSASSSGSSGSSSGSSGGSSDGSSGSSKKSVSSAIDTTKHDTTKHDTTQVASDKYSNVATLMPDGRILLPKYGNTIILPRYTSQSGNTAATAATASTAATSPTGESGMTGTSNPSWEA